MTEKKAATSGSYKPKWNHQPTEVFRVPEAFIDTLMGLAKLLDASVISLEQIEAWAEKQMANYKALKQVIVQTDDHKEIAIQNTVKSQKRKVRRPP
jgi:acyl-CoA synthetase (AMP-forming)/AMP-acid ligase II